jgi:hypothetical protein
MKAQPVSRLDWHNFYVKRYNKTGTEGAAFMATWYLILDLFLSEE